MTQDILRNHSPDPAAQPTRAAATASAQIRAA
jgi:hypothetical protein